MFNSQIFTEKGLKRSVNVNKIMEAEKINENRGFIKHNSRFL